MERKAIYDAHLDAKKWLFYPTLSGLSFGSLVLGSMFVTQQEPQESSTAMTLIASTSLVSSYFILNQIMINFPPPLTTLNLNC